MEEIKYVEVDGQKFVDDGTGNPKVDDDGQQVPFVEGKPEKDPVPYERFSEVVGEKNELKERVDILEGRKEEGVLTADEKKELEAKQALGKLLDEHLDKREKTSKAEKDKEDRDFKAQINEALELNPDVKRGDFVDFLEKEADKYGVTNVKGAMTLYKDFQKRTDETADKTKRDITGKPKSLQPAGGDTKVNWAEKDKDKSIDEIAEEATSDL